MIVRLNLTLVAASQRNADNLLEALQFHLPAPRLESGCLECYAWLGPDLTVHYVEDWATEADVRRRLLSDRFTSILSVVESAVDADVRFDFVSNTRGLEYIIEVREQTT